MSQDYRPTHWTLYDMHYFLLADIILYVSRFLVRLGRCPSICKDKDLPVSTHVYIQAAVLLHSLPGSAHPFHLYHTFMMFMPSNDAMLCDAFKHIHTHGQLSFQLACAVSLLVNEEPRKDTNLSCSMGSEHFARC